MPLTGRLDGKTAVITGAAADEASYVTGQAFPVDSGITASLSVPGRKI